MEKRCTDIVLCLLGAAALTAFFILFLLEEEQSRICLYMVGAIFVVWGLVHFDVSKRLREAMDRQDTVWLCSLVAAVLCMLFFFKDDHYSLFLIGTVCCYAVAVLGLNIQLGYTGVINFSAASFFGVGGYTAAMLLQAGLVPPLAAMLLGGLAAGLVGCALLLPVLRTSGHYSALVTMAFALLFNVFLEVNEWFGGPQGIQVAPFSLFGTDFSTDIEWGDFTASFYLRYDLLVVLFLVAAFTLTRRLERSWLGLCMDAVRVDEISASCFGINVRHWKIVAFSMGNVLIGMAGALYAMMLGYISPANFTFADSLLFLSILLLGGMGSIWGVVVATIIVVIIPEKLQGIQEYRYLLYSLLVLLMIVFRPAGLMPRRIRSYFSGGLV